MPEMCIKYRDGVPYRYMYGEEDAATALYLGDGYRTPEEAIEAYEYEKEK